MQTRFSEVGPGLFKNQNGEVEIHHNHFATIDYLSFINQERRLDQIIDQQKVALKGCITFFKTYAEDKTVDVALKAAAKGALEEDKARLKDFENHKQSNCVIL